ANGTRTATITVNNNDCDEAAYDFAVSGGRQASALVFDGSNDRVNVTGINLQIPAYTIEFWAKRTRQGVNEIITSLGSSGSTNQSLHIGFRANNAFMYDTYNTGLDIAGLSDLNWHHWAIVFDQNATTQSRKVYRDGVLVGSDNYNTQFAGSGTFTIGDYWGGTNAFAGSVDDFRIWNTARTCDQINQLRNCELAGNETGLVAYYKFNQNVADGTNTGATTLSNTVSGGANGTLTNFALNGSTSNWTSPGGVTTGTSCPASITAPEINVTGNSNTITDGTTTTSTTNGTDFGTALSKQFVIENTLGNATLNISGITLTGTNASDFSISGVPSTVNAGSSATFTVNFVGSGSGVRVATVNIANNDCDEGTYDFAIKATPQAIIGVKGNSIAITNNDITPSTTDGTSFGTRGKCQSPVQTFTIENTGNADLVIAANAIASSNNGRFTIGGNASIITITPGNNATFTVTLNPATTGSPVSTITIPSNDPNTSTFTFAMDATIVDTYTFTGVGNWDDDSKWTPHSPGLTFNSNTGCTIVINGTCTVPSSLATSIIYGNGNILVNSGAVLNINKLFVHAGPVTLTNDGTINIQGFGSNVDLNCSSNTVVNNGT
ncbi:MAG: choice-of-anchor D domain-containing protein, partial [Candidatus Kapabacteria bacterium]|nr:choice-of-anchor D domain-containing protein [Candidatus Kapabacteria bacterium]